MAYDEGLAETLREALAEYGPTEKRMFGGLCFMLRGHMLCGVESQRMMLRVGQELHDAALARDGAAPMDFTGRPMKGFVYVDAQRCGPDELGDWLDLALQFNRSLPARPG